LKTTEETSMSELLQMKNFQDCLNQTFHCHLDEATVDLELAEVVALPPKESEEVRRAPFSLLFLGPGEPLLAQQIYRLDNPQAGAMDIFLVPLGPKGDGMQYEAVFT
jgi:hypothetical protein